ncbi:MAG: OsmC family protein, partial [Verrucomicrobiia bacterium]
MKASNLPKPFLGTDQAPTPADYALHALAACMNTTMVYNCAARGFEVRSSSVQIDGDLDARGFLRMDDDIEARHKGVRVEFKVDSDGDPEVIEDLIKGSSMYNVFTTPIPIELTFA